MTTDLWMLVYTTLLCLGIPFIYVSAEFVSKEGIAWGFGNRDTAFDFPEWANRARRAHINMLENLAPFAVVVLIAHATGKANETTALGATIFFWGRVAHVLTYTAGIVYVRTAAFFVSAAGLLMILFQLF